METIVFNNENLWIGHLGRSFVIISFISALLAAMAFAWHTHYKKKEDVALAKGIFGLHLISVVGILGTLFYIIYNHLYEYNYAWQHSSNNLPLRYMISSFWSGQEGSFLLWLFWTAILGAALTFKKSEWRSPVMAVIMLCQAVLASMLLGIEIPVLNDFMFGSSPFQLLREVNPDVIYMPELDQFGLAKADYLHLITDGNSLNPLLQNYWMVIHPPTLFLGFASTVVPFAFAIAGLWTKQYKQWVKPALPWASFSGLVLGAGIIMGAFWAYESLTFGGYWAWDPVENASLIPWLVLIAGLHVMVINRSTGNSLGLAYVLIMGAFILVLYASFLTRSGILGDSSVHSFTDLGLTQQLLVFVLLFLVLPVLFSFKKSKEKIIYGSTIIALLVLNILAGKFFTGINLVFLITSGVLFARNFSKNLPHSPHDESSYSREFWMFIGSLILFLSAVQILFTTSIPVFNKITAQFGGFFKWLANLTGVQTFEKMGAGTVNAPLDIISHFNNFQIWFAIIMAVLSGLVQFLTYKKTTGKNFGKWSGYTFAISLFVTAIFIFIFHLHYNKQEFDLKNYISYLIFLFSATFAIVGNIIFMAKALRWKWKLSGSSVAHVGFGLMLMGILVSSSKKNVISENQIYTYGDKMNKQETRETIALFQNQPHQMQEYLVTYAKDTAIEPDHYYRIDYYDTLRKKSFSLKPNVQFRNGSIASSNPDTKHYLTRDVFTYLIQVPDFDENEFLEDSVYFLQQGDTIFSNQSMVKLIDVKKVLADTVESLKTLKGFELYVARLAVTKMDSTVIATPTFVISSTGKGDPIPSFAEFAGVKFEYTPGEDDNGNMVHRFQTWVKPQRYVLMRAIVFPYINLVWLGTIVMLVGFGLSFSRRRKENTR
ncbi:MAG: cytochrome c biogenesis protein CcsA [Flavobacteriales bacterium]|nr:cytochrome c biogenesis protein CcsA [Flavobacteriales bacterium]